MDNKAIWAAAQEQLALDLGCDPALLADHRSHVILWRDCKGRRRYNDNTPMLEVFIWRGKVVAACGQPLLPWAEAHFPTARPEWLFTPSVFRALEGALAPLGYELANINHSYLPHLPCPPAAPIVPVRWYKEGELEEFRGDPRWSEVLTFDRYAPDVLAVTALDESGAPAAMAACSQDGEKLWQISISVLPEHRGKGLGANLTALLRDEVLRRGAVPFYGTSESHIASQNVALRAGFVPAFAYLYARPKQKGT